MARLISLNVERTKHMQRVLPFLALHQPDVVCLQELTQSDIPRVKEAAGLVHCHYAPMSVHPLDQQPFGVGIFSRHTFTARDVIPYGGTGKGELVLDRTSPESRLTSCRYIVTRVAIQIDGRAFTIATTHFPWTPDGLERDFQSEALKRLISGLGKSEVILTGDFNAPRGGPIFTELARQWQDNIPAGITTSLDPMLHRAGPLELMVDGLFTTKHYHAEEVRLLGGLSDHKAVVARVSRATVKWHPPRVLAGPAPKS